MKLISYLLCLLFFAPLLTGCFGINEIEHDEALVGDWYMADKVVISFDSNGTVTRHAWAHDGFNTGADDQSPSLPQQGTWSTKDNRILDLEWNDSARPNGLSSWPPNSIFYTVSDGWLIALLPADGNRVEFNECDAVSKDNISIDNYDTLIGNLENLSIEPKKRYPCDSLGIGLVFGP